MIYKATRRVALLEKELVTLPIHVQPRFLVSCTRSCFSKPRWTVAFYCTEAGRHQVWTEKGRHPPPPKKLQEIDFRSAVINFDMLLYSFTQFSV